MKLNAKYLGIILVVIEVFIIVVYCLTYHKMESVEYPASALEASAGILQEDGSFIIGEESGAQEIFLQSELVPLRKGIYDVYVYYLTNTDKNRSDIKAEGNTYAPAKSNGAVLHADNTYEKYRVWVTESLDGLHVTVSYGGEGTLTVKGVEIRESCTTMTYHAFKLLLVFVVLDFVLWVLWNWRMGKKCFSVSTKRKIFFFILIVFMASYPVFTNYVIDGIDLEFHLTRIEGIKDGLLAGDFPVKMQPTWLNGHGYAVSVFYGDFLLYIPAVLRMIGFSLQTCYKFYIVMINALTCLLAWYSLQKVLKDEQTAILGSALYTISFYQMMELYVRAGIGSFTATAFVPLAVCGLIRIYQSEDDAERGLWIMPVAGFTGILQAQLPVFEITALFTIVTCLLLFKRTFQKARFLNLLKVVVFTILINLWYLVPFLDFMREKLQVTLESAYRGMDTYSLFLPQLFTAFHNGEGYTGQQEYGMTRDMPFAIGIALVIGALVMVYFLCSEKALKHKQLAKWMLGIGTVAAALTLTWVPFDRMAEKSALMRKILSFQFSWRLLIVVVMAFVIVTCITVLNLKDTKYYPGYVAVLCIAMLIPHLYFMDQRQVLVEPLFYYDLNPVDASTAVVKGEYLYEESKPWNLVRDQVIAFDGSVALEYSKKYLDLTITCENPTEQSARMDLPMLYYPGYTAVDQTTGKKLELVKGIENRLEMMLPAGFAGTVTVKWSEPWYWRVSELCSLTCIIGVILYDKKKKQHAV